MDNKKMKINECPRHGIQALWAFLTNSRVSGFVTGKIYTGKLKNVCVPGLNCYSCPGATGACPIGILCSRISDFCRSFAGKACLWIPLSVWADTGPAE